MILDSLSVYSWAITLISATISVSTIIILIICVCFKNKNKEINGLGMFNTNNQTKSSNLTGNQYGFFRKLSMISTSDITLRRSSDMLKPYKSSHYLNIKERSSSENELLDSMNNSNDFENSVLQIDIPDTEKLQLNEADESDETTSYLSNDSKFTVYSTFTITRGSSYAETMRSALSYTDLENH